MECLETLRTFQNQCLVFVYCISQVLLEYIRTSTSYVYTCRRRNEVYIVVCRMRIYMTYEYSVCTYAGGYAMF